MSFFSKVVNNFKEFYSEINGATLTGAIDVVVVQQEDGSYKSTPFHVRFGKMGVLKAREKIVDLEINGEPVDIQMKLDDTGVAYFIEDFEKDDEQILDDDIKSDTPGPWDYITLLEEISAHEIESKVVNEEAPKSLNMKKEKKKRRKSKIGIGEILSRRSLTEAFLNIETLSEDTDDMFDIDDLESPDQESDDISLAEDASSISNFQYPQVSADLLLELEQQTVDTNEERSSCDSGFSDSPFGFQLGDDIMTPEETKTTECQIEKKKKTLFKPKEEIIARNADLHPIYLKTILPEATDPLNIPYSTTKVIGTEKSQSMPVPFTSELNRTISRVDSGCEEELDSSTRNTLPEHMAAQLPDLAGSLCGGLAGAAISPEQFAADLLTYPQFVAQVVAGASSAVTHPSLVIRMYEKYLSWEQAAPILLSLLLFRKPLPQETVREMIKDCLDVNIAIPPPEDLSSSQKPASWLEWFTRTPKQEVSDDKSAHVQCIHPRKRLETESSTTSTQYSQKNYRKSLRLSSEMLSKMRLNPGQNEVQFSVTTAFQGTSRCFCSVYLWDHSDKVVISDIDGTITRSDVLGQLLPVIGNDWAQMGVARLFSKIRQNGYKIMYLSARAIGQAAITKDYLNHVRQGDDRLPDGPLFLNPDSLIHAFKREVIDRNPEEFKISCLKEIQSLFGSKNPFFAGYGNRPNDAYAYQVVGVPVYRIFTINPAGVVTHKLTNTFQTSYTEQDSVVDYVFPSLDLCDADPEMHFQHFSSFGFWREEFPVVVGPLELI